MVRGGTSELRTNADEVNRLNVFPVPDGDTGDNMRMTIESGFAAIENVNTDYIADVMKLFSHGMLIGARGNSGVILSQFFAGLAKGLESEEKAGPEALARALEMGVDVKTVSELLGHRTTNITLSTYIHSMFTYKIDVMNRLGNALLQDKHDQKAPEDFEDLVMREEQQVANM